MEFNKMGTSADQFEKAKGQGFAEIGKLKEGVSTHRIIVGPVRVETVWYPTLVEQNGELVQSMRTIIRPEGGYLLDPLVKMDEELTKRAMREDGGFSDDEIKVYRCPLRPGIAFRFLVFDRDLDNAGKPTVRVFDYPFTVKKFAEDLQTAKSKKHPGFLECGLIWMFDCNITKTVDPKKSSLYGTDYTMMPVMDTLPAMRQIQIPIEWMNWTEASGKPCPWKWEDFFTEDELTAINEFDSDLSKLAKSNTEEEIIEKLTKNPIYLHGTFAFGDKKGTPMFPVLCQPEVVEKLQEAYGKYLLVEKKDVALAQKQAPKQIGEGTQKPKQNVMEAKIIEETPTIEIKQEVKPVPKAMPLSQRLNIKPATSQLVKQEEAQTLQPATPTQAPVRKLWAPKKPAGSN